MPPRLLTHCVMPPQASNTLCHAPQDSSRLPPQHTVSYPQAAFLPHSVAVTKWLFGDRSAPSLPLQPTEASVPLPVTTSREVSRGFDGVVRPAVASRLPVPTSASSATQEAQL